MRHLQSAIAIFFIAACAHSTGAAAPNGTETRRCPDNSYSDRPCAGGKAVNVGDPRSDTDRRAADAATRRDRDAADALERSRLKQEAREHRASHLTVIGKPPAAEAAPAPHARRPVAKKRGRKESEYFTARGPGTEKTRAKAKKH